MDKKNPPTDNIGWIFDGEHIPALFGDGAVEFFSTSPMQMVLVIGNGSLFDEGVLNLLNYQPNLTTAHAVFLDDITILQNVEQYRPGVVVLLLTPEMEVAKIVNMLMSIPSMPQLRLVILGLDTNQVEIYQRGHDSHEISVTSITLIEVEDFLTAIYKNLNEGPSNQPL